MAIISPSTTNIQLNIQALIAQHRCRD